jgi:ribosomal protein S12 methylthiotransferase accessory factor
LLAGGHVGEHRRRDTAGGLMEAGTLAATFDTIYDPQIGIVSALDEVPLEPDAPQFPHYRAQICDPAALGGAATARTVEAAATSREAAVVAALRGSLSRYCAALYDRDGLPVSTATDAHFACLAPDDFALFGNQQYAVPGFPYVPFDDETPVRWTSAVDLATGETAYVPAAMVWFPFLYVRRAGDLPIVASQPGGLACGEGVAAAALAGARDVVARDAAALFWQAMIPAPPVRIDTLPPSLRDMARRFERTGDTIAILDITTDNRIPSVVAIVASERPERPAFVFAAAADLDPGVAIVDALCRLACNRRLAEATMQTRERPSPTNDWEDVLVSADHVNVAAEHGNRGLFAWISVADEQREWRDLESGATGSVDGDLEAVIGRILATGHRVYAANLTSEDIGGLGINVCRTVVPGYQPLFAGHRLRPLGGRRLYDVPRKLGHRGITRGSEGNPAPHPFP